MKLKQCCICENYKPSTLEYFHARSTSDDGLRCDCKDCRKEKKLKNYQKETKKCSKCNIEKPNTDEYFTIRNSGIRSRNRSMCKICHATDMRKNHLNRSYNLSENDYQKMYKNQNGKCAICCNYYEKLMIDHNHITNEVRDLLCDSCNRGIGFLRENITTLENAIKYIKHHSEKTN